MFINHVKIPRHLKKKSDIRKYILYQKINLNFLYQKILFFLNFDIEFLCKRHRVRSSVLFINRKWNQVESFSNCQTKLSIIFCRIGIYHIEIYAECPKHATNCTNFACQMSYGRENSIKG